MMKAVAAGFAVLTGVMGAGVSTPAQAYWYPYPYYAPYSRPVYYGAPVMPYYRPPVYEAPVYAPPPVYPEPIYPGPAYPAPAYRGPGYRVPGYVARVPAPQAVRRPVHVTRAPVRPAAPLPSSSLPGVPFNGAGMNQGNGGVARVSASPAAIPTQLPSLGAGAGGGGAILGPGLGTPTMPNPARGTEPAVAAAPPPAPAAEPSLPPLPFPFRGD